VLDDRQPEEPWMTWIAGYHRLMRAALVIKGETAPLCRGGLRLSDEALAPWVERASALAGWPIETATARALAQPPQGRIGPVVLTLLGAMCAVPAATLAATLFPTRRPSPYTLG
jgi:hypothetical protein